MPQTGQGLVQLELLIPSASAGGPPAAATNVFRAGAGTDAPAAAVAVDFLMLEPGSWGRYNGMHVRADLFVFVFDFHDVLSFIADTL